MDVALPFVSVLESHPKSWALEPYLPQTEAIGVIKPLLGRAPGSWIVSGSRFRDEDKIVGYEQ